MFEKASRIKLRFASTNGPLSVEELWDLPLTARPNRSGASASLDDIAKGLSKQVKENETESFVVKNPKADRITLLKFELVKHIIGVRLAEDEAAATASEKSAKKQVLLALVADKQNEQLKNSTIEELMAQINAL